MDSGTCLPFCGEHDEGGLSMVYKKALLKLIDRLSDKAIERIYRLAEYLYVYKEDVKPEETRV